MKSVFDLAARDELIGRIRTLGEDNVAKWGKMNVWQMVRHCVLCEELYLGKTRQKRALMGRLFGKIGLKRILAEGRDFPKNAPTAGAFVVKEPGGNLAVEKAAWIALLNEYQTYPDRYVHWFFGKMTKEQVGLFVYKHNDHHLRQFDA